MPHPPVIIKREDVLEENFGRWGEMWEDITFVGHLGGREVLSTQMVADPSATRLEVRADKLNICATENEETRIILRALDQADAVLPYISGSVSIQINEPATLMGPTETSLVGGSSGFWIRATGDAGEISISLTSVRFPTEKLTISATESE